MEINNVITFLVPFHMNKPTREYIHEMAKQFLDDNNVVRFNGNGGSNNQLSFEHDYFVNYLPEPEHLGLVSDIPLPDTDQTMNAYKIALTSFPTMKKWDESDQNKLLASVFSLYGYSNRKSDLVIIVRPRAGSIKSKDDRNLYYNALKLVKDAGIKTKSILPRT